MNKHLVFIVLLTLVVACRSKVEESISVNGVWASIGSGWVLEIIDSTSYQFYDITSISCLSGRDGNFSELEESLTLNNDTLDLLKGVITYQFTRREDLPKPCSIPSGQDLESPIYNFSVFAETVKEHYAFVELNDLSWEDIYAQQRRKLEEHSSDVELYQVIEETLALLNDNHAFLEATDEVYEELDRLSEQAEVAEESEDDVIEYGDFQVAGLVTKHHLQKELTRDFHLRYPLIQWGELNDEIGYIQVKAMWLYARLAVPEDRIQAVGYVDAYVETFQLMYEGDYIRKEVEEVARIMDLVMEDLSDMTSIVIDIRFNGGGQDAVSFEILSRFIPKGALHIATQQLRYGDQYTKVLPLYIAGTENAYIKPVYVLTSQQTGSAAEAFSIATLAMDNVKRIGSSTSGAMSTALEKTLPNGWSFAISNEIYMDNNGKGYENIGIPVDYDLHYPADRQVFFRSVVEDLAGDKKGILKAIEGMKDK